MGKTKNNILHPRRKFPSIKSKHSINCLQIYLFMNENNNSTLDFIKIYFTITFNFKILIMFPFEKCVLLTKRGVVKAL